MMHYGFPDAGNGKPADDVGGLFGLPPVPKPKPADAPQPGRLAADALVPRPYQLEDINATKAAWESGKRAVLYRAATGLGKATMIATMAATHRPHERTLCLIDTVKLANQLRATFSRQLGFQPGLIGGGIFKDADARVVICVQQSLNSEKDGETRAERIFDPTAFGTILIDECEAALAERYVALVRYFLNGNPDVHVLGCTATPIRGDGVGMGALFDHVIEEEGALNRGPLWAFSQGWLVPPRQAFVQCKVDFSTLAVRKGDNGDADYNDSKVGEKLAEMLSNEQDAIELAQAIVRSSGEDRCMVVCPNSTNVCDTIADYLNAAKPKSAMAVHGKIHEDPEAVMNAHQRGDFQYLCGVNMLTKGYDDPKIMKVYILRPTKSQRLFQQVIGRAFRPHDSIAKQLGDLANPEDRRALIANSPKPRATIYCLVGVDASARDMQIADLLRGRLTDLELDRVKQRMLDGVKDEDGHIVAGIDVGEDVGEALKEVRKIIRDEKAAAHRRKVEVQKAELQITEMKDGESRGRGPKVWTGAYEKCRQLGFKENELEQMSQEQAGRESQRWIARAKSKPRLCTKGQWRVLSGRGYKFDALETMTCKAATEAINKIAIAERWKPKGAA